MKEQPPWSLEAPLPVELAGSQQGWLTRYRRYPVFSAAWARGRVLRLGPLVLLAFALLVGPAVLMRPDPRLPLPIGGMLQIAIGLVLPLWLGPRLGLAVRRRGWDPAREWLALVSAMAAIVVAMVAFHDWGAEPLKQWIAERTGGVDAQGKRKRVVMSFGVSVAAADGTPTAAEVPDPQKDVSTRASNAVSMGLLTFWLAGGSALWGWRRERAGLQALARERELAGALAARREAELRLAVLAAQVEPHFLFNTLAGVRSAITTDPARASEMVDGLAEYLRAAIPRLRTDGQVQATLGAQLDLVRAYLGLMRARMPRLQVQIEADSDLLAARFPPLMLISLAENAVKHGVERKAGPARIVVRAVRQGDALLAVSVADDGAGFQDARAGSGLGLANVRARLHELYPQQAALTLEARPEGGVVATITLPLELTADALDEAAPMPSALIADDEDLPRAELRRMLTAAWPELQVVADCEDGVSAIEALDALRPDVAFLDIRMPGPSGLDVARAASGRCHVVFTTAHDRHAIEAFDAGAVDYLLKPVLPARLAHSVARLRQRLDGQEAAPPLDRLVDQLAERMRQGGAGGGAQRLRWISASVGDTIKLFGIDEVLFFQSDEKYTRVVTAGDEAHVRKPLKEIAEGLDGDDWWQVHRGVIVRAAAVARAQRDEMGRITLHLKQHDDKLPVSQAYAWRFKPM